MTASPDGTVGIAHRVVADGDASVAGPLCRFDVAILLEHILRDACSEGIGGNHAIESLVVHLFHQLEHDEGSLAETGKDEGTAVVQMFQIVVERVPHIVDGYGQSVLED